MDGGRAEDSAGSADAGHRAVPSSCGRLLGSTVTKGSSGLLGRPALTALLQKMPFMSDTNLQLKDSGMIDISDDVKR